MSSLIISALPWEVQESTVVADIFDLTQISSRSRTQSKEEPQAEGDTRAAQVTAQMQAALLQRAVRMCAGV